MIPSGAGGRAVDLLHEIVAIPSVTGSEAPLIDFVRDHFRRRGWIVEEIAVSPGRQNLLIRRGKPRIVLMTHADTVPPYFEPRRQGSFLFARGACDAKGSLAAMAVSLEEIGRESEEAALLLLVGEERGSDGAIAANRRAPQTVEYIVGGEPTGNHFVAGSKGCLRITVEARGQAGHSSVTEGAASAVPPLLDFLETLRGMDLPEAPVFGGTTLNIGVLQAGTAPNVIADRARAEILFRTGVSVEELLSRIRSLATGNLVLEVPYRSDPLRFRVPKGSRCEVVSFACDLPLLSRWGQPLLAGPGSIRDAHAADEKVDLSEVEEAVAVYGGLVTGLLSQGDSYLEPSAADPSAARSPDPSSFTSRSYPRA